MRRESHEHSHEHTSTLTQALTHEHSHSHEHTSTLTRAHEHTHTHTHRRLDNTTRHQWVSFAKGASVGAWDTTTPQRQAAAALDAVSGLHPRIIHKGGGLWRGLRPCGEGAEEGERGRGRGVGGGEPGGEAEA